MVAISGTDQLEAAKHVARKMTKDMEMPTIEGDSFWRRVLLYLIDVMLTEEDRGQKQSTLYKYFCISA
eukprot:7274722-Ditylum_brightwellii.AAC.1